MPSMLSGRVRSIPIFLLGAGLLLTPIALRAQTFDSTAGTAPSEKLSTPPNSDPINRPGAMERAYTHRPPAVRTTRQKIPTPQPRKPAGATPR